MNNKRRTCREVELDAELGGESEDAGWTVFNVERVPRERGIGDRGKRKHRYSSQRWRGQQLKSLLYADHLVRLIVTGERTGSHRRFDKRPRRG